MSLKLKVLGQEAELDVPDILKPEIPILSLLKRVSKFTQEYVVLIGDHGRSIKLCEMKMDEGENWLFDDMKRTRYIVQHGSIRLQLSIAAMKPQIVRAYLVDEKGATTIELDSPGDLKEVNSVSVESDIDGAKKINKLENVKTPLKIAGYAISNLRIIGNDKEAKEAQQFLADLQAKENYKVAGATLTILPDDIMLKFRANPDVWAAYVEANNIGAMFTAGLNIGIIIVIFVVGAFVGWLGGGFLGAILGSMVHL